MTSPSPLSPARHVERVRHELKFRIATVVRVERLTPRMVRIAVRSDAFEGFRSLAFDDHVKLFFPEPGQSTIALPERGPNGLVFPDGRRPEARDYTPRRFDPGTLTLELDFVLHGEGPATRWAQTAAPGHVVGVGGPRGSFVLRGAFDWYLLIGDETALPAIGRRVEELDEGAHAIVIADIPDDAERQHWRSAATLAIHWLARNGAEHGDPRPVIEALDRLTWPGGEGYAWIAGENGFAKAMRSRVLEKGLVGEEWIKASGYWQRGDADFDDGHAD